MNLMTIGQLAQRAGIRPSAIRYYEAHGVLQSPIRSSAAYRLYGPEAIRRLRFVVQAKELGFSLDEIRQLIESSKNEPPCVLCRELIEHHLAAIDDELRRLRSLRDSLKQLLDRPTPRQTTDEICPLIESSHRSNSETHRHAMRTRAVR